MNSTNATVQPDCPYLTIEEASAIMNLSIQMVYVLVKTDRLAAYRHTAKLIRVHRDDVTAYLQSIRTGKPAEAEPSTREPKLQALQPRRREGKKRKTAEAAAH